MGVIMLWTKAEDDFLREYRPGMTSSELLEVFNRAFGPRTLPAIKRRCTQLKIKVDRETRVRISVAAGLEAKKAFCLKSTPNVVISHVSPEEINTIWTADQDALLREAKKRGSTIRKITESLRKNGHLHSRDAIRDRVKKLGLSYKELRVEADVESASKYFNMAVWSDSEDPWADNWQKGVIAEAAVMFRLGLLGLRSYSPSHEGDPADIMVIKNGKVCRVQVKWARKNDGGTIFVPLSRGWKSRKSYLTDDSVDVIVGYELRTDSSFVFDTNNIEEDRKVIPCDALSLEKFEILDRYLS